MAEPAEGFLIHGAMLWNRRKARTSPSVVTAHAAVTGLTPAVVVTGGSLGIGKAMAQRFAEAGHRVAIVARDQAKLIDAAAGITAASNNQVLAIVCDVTAAGAFERIAAELKAAGLYCDTLVNSAAVGLSGPFLEQTADRIDGLLTLNVTALTRLCRQALPGMIARQQGGILNFASIGGYAPGPHQAAYYASKAYVVSLTEALAAECSGFGVRISVVAPGPVDTGFHAAMGAERARYRTLLPSLTPEQVASNAYRGYRFGQRVIIPGLFNRVLFLALRLSPHPVSVPLVAWLLKNPGR